MHMRQPFVRTLVQEFASSTRHVGAQVHEFTGEHTDATHLGTHVQMYVYRHLCVCTLGYTAQPHKVIWRKWADWLSFVRIHHEKRISSLQRRHNCYKPELCFLSLVQNVYSCTTMHP